MATRNRTPRAPAAKPSPSPSPSLSPAVGATASLKASPTVAPKPARKPAAKPAAPAGKPVATKAAATPSSVQPPMAIKGNKAAKEPKARLKPVRDSFTMPEADFTLIATLKARALGARRETKKSELLRAGLHALAAMDAGPLVAALNALAPVKVGRPRKGH